MGVQRVEQLGLDRVIERWTLQLLVGNRLRRRRHQICGNRRVQFQGHADDAWVIPVVDLRPQEEIVVRRVECLRVTFGDVARRLLAYDFWRESMDDRLHVAESGFGPRYLDSLLADEPLLLLVDRVEDGIVDQRSVHEEVEHAFVLDAGLAYGEMISAPLMIVAVREVRPLNRVVPELVFDHLDAQVVADPVLLRYHLIDGAVQQS